MKASSKSVELKHDLHKVEIFMGHHWNSWYVLKQISYLFPLGRQTTFHRKGSEASEWIWYVNNRRWDSEGRRTDGTLMVQRIQHFSLMPEKNVNYVTLASQCKVIRQTITKWYRWHLNGWDVIYFYLFLLEIFQYLIATETKIHI